MKRVKLEKSSDQLTREFMLVVQQFNRLYDT